MLAKMNVAIGAHPSLCLPEVVNFLSTMSIETLEAERSNTDIIETENESEIDEYGEGAATESIKVTSDEEIRGESEKNWENIGEYGEARKCYIFAGEISEYPPVQPEYESSTSSVASVVVSEVEETEEEKELRREREMLIEEVRQKLMERMLLKRRNAFLQKKLVELYKKRRMENILKEEPKGLDLESKYLKRLFAFKEFKQAHENEIEELTISMEQYEAETKLLEEEINEKIKAFVARAKEVSLNLILSKSGKKINEKTVDRLLRRLIQKNDEKGQKKLRFIKIKNLIEEKEQQLKAMEYFGDGLHIADYEQMKIDNQNYTDKIEEKEDELIKLRTKTQGIIQNLAHVREKAYAVEGDIELMVEKVYAVEKELTETRERLTNARKKRDFLREEFSRLKAESGLLTRDELLRDFEASISKANNLKSTLNSIKRAISEKTMQENELAKLVKKSSNQLPDLKLRLLPGKSFSSIKREENRPEGASKFEFF